MNLTHVPVKSSQIKSVAYHPETKTMEVTFLGSANKPEGSTYRYADVSAELHAKMMAAPSVGKFLHGFIKGNFAHTKVEAPSKK